MAVDGGAETNKSVRWSGGRGKKKNTGANAHRTGPQGTITRGIRARLKPFTQFLLLPFRFCEEALKPYVYLAFTVERSLLRCEGFPAQCVRLTAKGFHIRVARFVKGQRGAKRTAVKGDTNNPRGGCLLERGEIF